MSDTVYVHVLENILTSSGGEWLCPKKLSLGQINSCFGTFD